MGQLLLSPRKPRRAPRDVSNASILNGDGTSSKRANISMGGVSTKNLISLMHKHRNTYGHKQINRISIILKFEGEGRLGKKVLKGSVDRQ